MNHPPGGQMELDVKCFATLAHLTPPEGHCDVPEGCDVAQLMMQLGVPAEEVRIIFVNGVHAEAETKLKAGDRLGLFPPVGGG